MGQEDWKIVGTVFNTVFLAELGGLGTLATLLFAAETPAAKGMVFLGASIAMLLMAGIAVLAGAWIIHHVSPKVFHFIAGGVFLVIGLWSLRQAVI